MEHEFITASVTFLKSNELAEEAEAEAIRLREIADQDLESLKRTAHFEGKI